MEQLGSFLNVIGIIIGMFNIFFSPTLDSCRIKRQTEGPCTTDDAGISYESFASLIKILIFPYSSSWQVNRGTLNIEINSRNYLTFESSTLSVASLFNQCNLRILSCRSSCRIVVETVVMMNLIALYCGRGVYDCLLRLYFYE